MEHAKRPRLPLGKIQRLILLNIQGLHTRKRKDKAVQLAEIAKENNATIIAVTETHLREEILSAVFEVKGFSLQRVDRRRGTKKRGVAIYLRDDITSLFGSFHGDSIGNIEFLCTYSPKWNLVLCVIYRPEGTTEFDKVVQQVEIYAMSKGPPLPNIILVGDFNFPQIEWELGRVEGGRKSALETKQALRLFESIDALCLEQIVHEPTRLTNILDLIMTNNNDMIYDCKVSDPGISDHKMIIASLDVPDLVIERTRVEDNLFATLNFHSDSIEWHKLSEDLAQEFGRCSPAMNASEHYESFIEILSECCRKHVPARSRQVERKIPRDRRILMRRRCKLQRRARHARAERALLLTDQIATINLKLRQSINKEMDEEETRAVQAIKANPKYFFTYAKKRCNMKPVVGPLESDGRVLSDAGEVASELNDYYSAMCTHPHFQDVSTAIENWAVPNRENTLEELEIVPTVIEDSLGKLKENSAPGPDGVPAILLKRCAGSLSKPLVRLWQASFNSGTVPNKLKQGLVTPIFKGGDRGLSGNYRPVVLTSHVAKVFERVVATKVTEFLESEDLLDDEQHGFRRGRSCVSQLLQHYHKGLRSMEMKQDVDVIYLDFQKAFDKVDHGILLCKLKSLGITGKVAKWIEAFLEDRKQKVIVRGHHSDWIRVRSGVP